MRFLRPSGLAFFIWSSILSSSLWAQELPDGPGKKELEKLCGTCHGAEAVMGVARMDRDGWQQKVFEMIGPGAPDEQADVKAIVDYLVANRGPAGGAKPSAPNKVNVNEANAKELESVLSLSPAAAEALVKYRQANGRFSDLQELKKALAAIAAGIAEEKKGILAF